MQTEASFVILLLMNRYNPADIEPRWQRQWQESGIYQAQDFSTKPKYVMLTEFPYPSGDGLHLGHTREYTLGDIMARYKRMQGHNVLYPMGYDAFGLPTENYAIKNKIAPQVATAQNIANFRAQFDKLGFSFDWTRSFSTTDPEYYRWTQWLFLQFYKHDMAYQADVAINWCPKCKTGLANEEVVGGLHERCDTPVEKKQLTQWMLRITKYADRLIDGLQNVDYPSRIADQQINWIGRSVGAEIDFEIEGNDLEPKPNFVILHGFTGRADKNFIPKLKADLETRGYVVQAPQMPDTDNPVEKDQVQHVLDTCKIDENTVLIGHSLGGAVAMKVLQQVDHSINALVLVAPVIEPAFRPTNYRNENLDKVRTFVDTFDLTYDYEQIIAKAKKRIILSDTGEINNRKPYLEYLTPKIDAEFYETTASQVHFTGDDEPFILKTLDSIYLADSKITVFTTRPDTIFGATFMVLAPEHELVSKLTTEEQRGEVDRYVRVSQAKSDIERQDTDREKTGVFTGGYAINPMTHQKVPVWIADYVLMGYGTGAIMAVPAHDERDYEFATKFDLPIAQVIAEEFNDRLEEAERVTGVNVIGYDPEIDKFMVLHNKKADRLWLVSGGLNDGEEYETAAVRELAEEAGYHDIKTVLPLSGFFYTYFYNSDKNSNRKGTGVNYLAIISQAEEPKSANESHEDYEVKWLTKAEMERLALEWSSGGAHWSAAIDSAILASDTYNNVTEYIPPIFSGDGVLINSGSYDDVPSAEARELIVQHLEREGKGKQKINYRLRDWIFSRQHYWGEPIPIIHCPEHGAVAVPDDQLPVTLPDVENYEPTDTGESPLAAMTDWVSTTCPTCGAPAKRETDTMPNWAGSSWYYARYFDAHNDKEFADPKKLAYWGMVDMYLGGMEHTTLHLLYSRFWHLFLHEQGLYPTPEPYAARRGQGIILAEDGRKMSKSLGNVINPNEIINSGYGADALRLCIAFIAPYDMTTPWNSKGVAGTHRYLNRLWGLVNEFVQLETTSSNNSAGDQTLEKAMNKAIKKVSQDLRDMGFNTAVAALMEYLNELYSVKNAHGLQSSSSWRMAIRTAVQLSAPLAPHITEELWKALGEEGSVHLSQWPSWDNSKLVSDTMTLAIQVNGKVRAEIDVPAGTDQKEIEKMALQNERVIEFIDGKPVKRVIYVVGRLVNVVI